MEDKPPMCAEVVGKVDEYGDRVYKDFEPTEKNIRDIIAETIADAKAMCE